MSGVGIGELFWLAAAVLLGLGVVIAWIIKAEMSRNLFKDEIKRLMSQLASAEHEKAAILDEMNEIKNGAGGYNPGEQVPGDSASGNIMLGKMVNRVEELEKDNLRLTKELNEARSSLEEVYKALCSK